MNKYPFFAIHPDWQLSELAYVHIMDVPDVEAFSLLWDDEDWDIQGEFGHDLPLHVDNQYGVEPAANVSLADMENKMAGAFVMVVTYEGYVQIIRNVVSEREMIQLLPDGN